MIPNASFSPQLILVVEDDTLLRQSLGDILEVAGYAVITARDGRDALDALLDSDEIPTAILCDVNMPQLNGYQFLEAVRTNEEWTDIATILLSGGREPGAACHARDSGAVAYLTKPFTVEELLAAVRGASFPASAG